MLALLLAPVACMGPQAAPAEALEPPDADLLPGAEVVFPGGPGPLAERAPPSAAPEPPRPLPPAPSSDRPRIDVSLFQPEDGEWAPDDGCLVDVQTHGLPAISADGASVVFAELEVDDASTDEAEGVFSVQWLDANNGEGQRLEVIYDSYALEDVHEKHPRLTKCVAYEREANKAARRVNEAIKAEGWRTLSKLDLQLPDPYGDGDDDEESTDLRTIAAADRPVEMFWRAGRLVARTPGVKVYLNEPAPWGNDGANYDPGPDEEFDVSEYSACDYEPRLGEVYGDRDTGVLMVVYSYDRQSTGCLCDGLSYREIIKAPPELFERLDALQRRAAAGDPPQPED